MSNYDILIDCYENGVLSTAGLVALLEADEVFRKYVFKRNTEDRLQQIQRGK